MTATQRIVAALTLLGATTCLRAQAPAAGDGALVATILRSVGAMEAAWRSIAVDAVIDVVEYDGVAVSPSARTSLRYASRGGCVSVDVRGCDLDVGHGGLRRDASRKRLLFPGGVTESFDATTAAFSRDRRSYVDPTMIASDLGPAEFAWSFCGTARSVILAARVVRIGAVRGVAPTREVELIADDAAGVQRIAFSCREDWGWLAARATMSVRGGAEWRELRRIEVTTARPTRMGFFPRDATLAAMRPGGEGQDEIGGFRRLRARHAFGEPTFAAIAVPPSLLYAGADTKSTESTPALRALPHSERDPILSAASPLFREPIASRSEDLARLLAPASWRRSAIAGRDGARSADLWVGAGALAVAILLAVGGLASRSRPVVVASGLAGALGVAWVAAGVIDLVRPASAEAASVMNGLSRVPGPIPPAAKTLCGVDALAIAIALRRAPEDYSRLVRLVRPGAHGTSLEALLVAAECLGAGPRLVNPRSFAAPPDPLIAHVAPGHFVVVTAASDGDVMVIDASQGVFRGAWDRVRGALSPIAIMLANEEES